jgi:hypothetical protein
MNVPTLISMLAAMDVSFGSYNIFLTIKYGLHLIGAYYIDCSKKKRAALSGTFNIFPLFVLIRACNVGDQYFKRHLDQNHAE